MESFAGKVALVTGGSSGIGKATALAFAKGGANVVIAARGEQLGTQTVDEITAAGGKAIFVPTDVSKSADVERLIARTVDAFGRLDYAFNNAANPDGSIGFLADLTDEDFDKSVSINLKSVWLGMKYQNSTNAGAGASRRSDREHLLGERTWWLPASLVLRRCKGRSHRPEQVCSVGVRTAGRSHQCSRAGGIPHSHARRFHRQGRRRRPRSHAGC